MAIKIGIQDLSPAIDNLDEARYRLELALKMPADNRYDPAKTELVKNALESMARAAHYLERDE